MKLAPILFLLLFIAPVFAQEDWKTKDFDKWNAADVEAILNNSAWVKSQEVRLHLEASALVTPQQVAQNISLAPTDARETVGTGTLTPGIDFTFTLRLRSSMAIRLALIRKNQLETDTKKLSPKELELFNQRQKGLYECPACAQNYVVTLSSKSQESKGADAVYATFGAARFADIQRYILLQNDRGEQRKLVHFVPPKAPGDEAQFFFERYDEKNNLLFTKKDKTIILNLTNNQVNTVTNFRIDTAPLIVGDRVDF
jgi:hypothetical protein